MFWFPWGPALARMSRGSVVIHSFKIVVIACSAFYFFGCAYVPALQDASGVVESDILIRDVVRRVKCEISDAFDQKITDQRFLWLENWTAKVDLTLQVNEQAGLTPTVSYTKFFRNAFNTAAGSSSLTSNVIAAVPQFFTLTAGANLSEQAQRSETVSFTLALKEIKTWRLKQRNVRARAPSGASLDEIICDPSGAELRGKLGLREWVESALYPAGEGELMAGFHPAPPNVASKPPTPTSPGPKSFVSTTVKAKIAKIELDDAAKAANASSKAAVGSQAKVNTSVTNVETHRNTVIGPYWNVLTDELKVIISNNISTLGTIKKYVDEDVANANKDAGRVQDIRDRIALMSDDEEVDTDYLSQAKRFKTGAAKFADHADTQQKDAAKIEDKITKFTPNAPVDGLLHSIQFVVTYGASVTPSWTLLQWKGPGLTVPGASASGIRTHILNIALGAPSEQNRLIQNQTVMNSGSHP